MKPTKAELEHKQHEDYNRREAELAQREREILIEEKRKFSEFWEYGFQ
jgi:hypothetical protein